MALLWKRLILWGDLVPRDPLTATVLTVAGGAVAAGGTLAAGNAARQSAYFKAAQEDMAAQESRASSQRQAMESKRKAALTTSRIQALGAASGTDASSGDILKLSTDVAGRGEYQALADMYTGENRARGLQDAAMGDRYSGDAAQTASRYQAAGTLLSSGGSAYSRFAGMGGGFTGSSGQGLGSIISGSNPFNPDGTRNWLAYG